MGKFIEKNGRSLMKEVTKEYLLRAQSIFKFVKTSKYYTSTFDIIRKNDHTVLEIVRISHCSRYLSKPEVKTVTVIVRGNEEEYVNSEYERSDRIEVFEFIHELKLDYYGVVKIFNEGVKIGDKDYSSTIVPFEFREAKKMKLYKNVSSEDLEKILKEKVISLEETSYGITNKNYIITTDNNKYFYRTSKDSTNIVNKNNEREAITLLANEDYFLKPIFFNNDNLITEFQPNPKTFISQRKLSSIIRIAKLLNNFHSKKFQAENIFDPIKQFYNYYNQIDEKKSIFEQYLYIIDDFRKFYEPDRLCHNDLVEGNFLFSKDKLYLIDFEYAGYNDYYFDIASFISENDLNYEETITFLKAYFNDKECHYKKLDVFLQFCDLLWYTWAILLYEKRNEEVYNEIAQAKLHRLNNPRKIVY